MQNDFFNILDELFQNITGKPATKFATPDTFIEVRGVAGGQTY